MPMPRHTASVLALALALAVAGCARVKPHQRATLAAPHMQFQTSDGAARQSESIREFQEGSSFSGGAAGGAGGGCGCN